MELFTAKGTITRGNALAPKPPKDQDLLEREEEKTAKSVQQLNQLLLKLEALVDKDPEQCELEFFNVDYLLYQLPPKLRTKSLLDRIDRLQKTIDTLKKHAVVSHLDTKHQEDKKQIIQEVPVQKPSPDVSSEKTNEDRLFDALKFDEDRVLDESPLPLGPAPKQEIVSEDQEDLQLLQKLEKQESEDEKKGISLDAVADVDKTITALDTSAPHLFAESSKKSGKVHVKELHTKKEPVHAKEKQIHAQKEHPKKSQPQFVQIPLAKPKKNIPEPVQEEDLDNGRAEHSLPFEKLPAETLPVEAPAVEIPVVQDQPLEKKTFEEEFDALELPFEPVPEEVKPVAKPEPKIKPLPQQPILQPKPVVQKQAPQPAPPVQQVKPVVVPVAKPVQQPAVSRVQSEPAPKKIELQSEKIDFVNPSEITDGTSSTELYERGLHFFHQRNYNQAIACFKAVLKIAPNNLAARIRLQELVEEMKRTGST